MQHKYEKGPDGQINDVLSLNPAEMHVLQQALTLYGGLIGTLATGTSGAASLENHSLQQQLLGEIGNRSTFNETTREALYRRQEGLPLVAGAEPPADPAAETTGPAVLKATEW